jgi:hypothetical protein
MPRITSMANAQPNIRTRFKAVYFELSAQRMNALCKAIDHHSAGKVHDHATIQT